MTGEGRFNAMLLGSLPILLTMYLRASEPEYFDAMWEAGTIGGDCILHDNCRCCVWSLACHAHCEDRRLRGNGMPVIENFFRQLERLGVPIDTLLEYAIFGPVLLFLVTIGLYGVSAMQRKKRIAHDKIARGILSGARKRSMSMSQQEIAERLQPKVDELKHHPVIDEDI